MKKTGRVMGSLLLSLVLGAGLLSGCGSSQTAETEAQASEAAAAADEEKSLTVASGQSWGTADLLQSYDGWYYVRYGIGETLTKMNDDMTISGWLVEDGYTASEDQTTWTFTVRDGVTFSNGDVCDAAAVKASLENVMENGERVQDYFTAADIQADGQTLTIVCDQPEPILPNKLADPYFTVVDMNAAYEDLTDNGYIATGPFVLESFDITTKETVVKKNENYWNGDVQVDSIDFIYSEEQSALTNGLKNGQFDAVYNVSMSDVSEFENDSNYQVVRTASGRTAHGFMNQNGQLGDETLRKAIMQCIDKETICEYQLNGQYIAGKTLITSSADYGYDELTDPNTYDIENAAKLLDDAGYVDLDGDGYREDPEGNPIDLQFIYYTGRPEQQIMVEATQMQASQIGIKITPVVHDTQTVIDELAAGEYDLLCMSINVLNCADPENHMKTYFEEGGSYANYGWSNDEFNQIMEELSTTVDPETRKELVKQGEQILLDESVCMFFCYPLMNFTMKNNVTGITSTPADYYWVSAETDIQ